MADRFFFLRVAASKSPINAVFPFAQQSTLGSAAVHYWPAKRGIDTAPEHVTVLMLGNPGSLDYYTKFMHYIQDQLPDSHALLALSHVGADPRLPPPEDGPLDLPQHLATKIDFIQSLKQSLGEWARETDNNAPQPKVALVGHSVGAWLTVEIMKRVDIEAGYLMFPTLGWIADTHNGWKLWPIFRAPLFQFLPMLAGTTKPVTSAVCSAFSVNPATAEMIGSSNIVRSVLTMATSEMKVIRSPDLEWYKAQAQKPRANGVYGVWSGGSLDGWVGKEGPMIRNVLGEKRSTVLDGVPHAFVLNDAHSQTVADVVAGWINGSKPNGHL